jgi:hypothetical protein
MKTLRLVRFRFLAALAVVVGSTLSVWATYWPGYSYPPRDGCYNYGKVTWICLNPTYTGYQQVWETILRQDLNLYCVMIANGTLGYPAEMQEFDCTADVAFELWICPSPDGPLYDAGYEELVTRRIPKGRDVTYCQDPG